MLGKKLLRKRATLQDIYRLYQVIIRVPKILDVLNDLECVTIKNAICDPIRDALTVSFSCFCVLGMKFNTDFCLFLGVA